MSFSSIRARITFMSIAFGILLIGVVTVASYLLVGNGMARSAEHANTDLAEAARVLMGERVDEAYSVAHAAGLAGEAADEYVNDAILGHTPESLETGLLFDAGFALYYAETEEDGHVQLAWSGGEGLSPGGNSSREAALHAGKAVSEFPDRWPSLRGLFVSAELGTYVVHVPLNVPGVAGAVLDVAYVPRREAAVIDAMRLPMALVALVALGLSLTMSKATTGWALSLVRDLREAADAIEVGHLEVHLPAEGNNEIAYLARSLNGLVDTLRRGHEVQRRFIADASHELATPVAGIRGYVNILREWGAEDPDVREEALDALDRESGRMARLCQDLLFLIRSEETVEYQNVRYDINAVCREVLAGAANRYLERQLELAGPAQEPIWLTGDPERIEEALGILVDNACKYTPEGGRVSVRTRRAGNQVIVEVADTGVGIPEKDLPFIFERFYRSDQSRSQETGGFGLGLAIAKNIIDTSGGSISVTSRIGLGTTFQVVLPKRKSE